MITVAINSAEVDTRCLCGHCALPSSFAGNRPVFVRDPIVARSKSRTFLISRVPRFLSECAGRYDTAGDNYLRLTPSNARRVGCLSRDLLSHNHGGGAAVFQIFAPTPLFILAIGATRQFPLPMTRANLIPDSWSRYCDKCHNLKDCYMIVTTSRLSRCLWR
jgi:hypothetical protein